MFVGRAGGIAIIAVLAAQLLCGCTKKSTPPCDFRYILILDRTTKFDERSKELFSNGIERLLENRNMSGELYSYEIRSSGLGYTKLIEPISFPQLVKRFEPRDCTGGVYDTRYAECQRQNDKEEQLFKERTAARQNIFRSAIERLTAAGSGDAPSYANTNISEALINIIQQDCIGFNCVVFMMSDLIEPATRQIAHYPTRLPDAVIRLKATVQPLPGQLSRGIFRSLEMLVWGVGRDEINGRELSAAGKDMLVSYWRELFLRMGFHDDLILSYEFPDISKLSFGRDTPGSACDNDRLRRKKEDKRPAP